LARQWQYIAVVERVTVVEREPLASEFAALGISVELREIDFHPPNSVVVGDERAPRRRALVAESDKSWRSLSWATCGGGVSLQPRYICAEVRNADLPLGVAPEAVAHCFFEQLGFLEQRGLSGQRGLPEQLGVGCGVLALTSADVAAYATGAASEGRVMATALVTVGLANALRVGEPHAGAPRRYLPDTINLACWVNVPLTFEAQLEALSIVTQARTLEVLEAQVPSLEQNGWASGTGTDCVTLFTSDESADVERYAGMHTTVGRVLGSAARRAVGTAVRTWKIKRARAQAEISR
jgi:adenosylcobinamide amidohydrolase